MKKRTIQLVNAALHVFSSGVVNEGQETVTIPKHNFANLQKILRKFKLKEVKKQEIADLKNMLENS